MPKVVIGSDDLPMTEVGAWTVEKHKRLEKYVDISRYVRRRFAQTETTYIELFCGPGRSIIEGTPDIIDGSAILAGQTAKSGGYPYTDVHLADADERFVQAACKRMPQGVGRIHPHVGDAENTVDDVVRHLNKHGLHFAFLDPYALDPLSFSILDKLAAFKRMDMLIHVSIQDFQRNLRRYMEEGLTLERFAPGWRKVINPDDNDRNIRIAIFNHWLGLIQKLDMAASQGIEKVVGSNRQPLYWLVFVARHRQAHKFWNEIKNIGDQRELF